MTNTIYLETRRASRHVYTLKSLCTSRPFVHPSIRAYSPACLCRCPGPVHRWDRTECRGGRSSKRPTQFQPGSQLLLVLRRSAENERRTSGVCVVWRRSARLYPLVQTPWSSGSSLQLSRARYERNQCDRRRGVDTSEFGYRRIA